MGDGSIQGTVDIYGQLIPGANVALVNQLDGPTSHQQAATQPQQRARQKSDRFKEALPNEWLGGTRRLRFLVDVTLSAQVTS